LDNVTPGGVYIKQIEIYSVYSLEKGKYKTKLVLQTCTIQAFPSCLPTVYKQFLDQVFHQLQEDLLIDNQFPTGSRKNTQSGLSENCEKVQNNKTVIN
jgi:hypothetical protein